MDIDLVKPLEIVLEKRNLLKVVSRVGFAIDVSGSMGGYFARGEVDALNDRCFAVADRFDDNHEMDVKAFDTGVYDLPGMTDINKDTYIKRYVEDKVMGGTAYAPCLKSFYNDWFSTPKTSIFSSFFGGKKKVQELPGFLIFQTDGDNCHERSGLSVEHVLNQFIVNPMFVFFLGFGSHFPKLEAWAKQFENVDFMAVNSVKSMTPDDFYERLISEKLAAFYGKHSVNVA